MDNDIYIVWPLPFRGRNGGKGKKGNRNEKEGNYPYFVILFKIGPSLMTAIKVRKKNWEEYKNGGGGKIPGWQSNKYYYY